MGQVWIALSIVHNHYSLDKSIGFGRTYLMANDLSAGSDTIHWINHYSLDNSVGVGSIYSFHCILIFIIWQAPQADKMNQIPLCDWLPEWARWSKIFSMAVKRFSVISLLGWN